MISATPLKASSRLRVQPVPAKARSRLKTDPARHPSKFHFSHFTSKITGYSAHSRVNTQTSQPQKTFHFQHSGHHRQSSTITKLLFRTFSFLSQFLPFKSVAFQFEPKLIFYAFAGSLVLGLMLFYLPPESLAQVWPQQTYWPIILLAGWVMGNGLSGFINQPNFVYATTIALLAGVWLRLIGIGLNPPLLLTIAGIWLLCWFYAKLTHRYLFSRKSRTKGILL